jgi:hypothetical protein
MRAGTPLIWLLTAVCCFAQQADKKLLDRVTAKPDMSLLNSMNGKKFEGGGNFFLDKKPATSSGKFAYESKVSVDGYHNTRSFLGIKNPWLGNLVYDAGKANIWSKSLVANADTRIPTNSAPAGPFFQSGKKAAKREEPVKTSAYQARGSAQGSVNQFSDKIDKKMTIEQVREILNKNR